MFRSSMTVLRLDQIREGSILWLPKTAQERPEDIKGNTTGNVRIYEHPITVLGIHHFSRGRESCIQFCTLSTHPSPTFKILKVCTETDTTGHICDIDSLHLLERMSHSIGKVSNAVYYDPYSTLPYELPWSYFEMWYGQDPSRLRMRPADLETLKMRIAEKYPRNRRVSCI